MKSAAIPRNGVVSVNHEAVPVRSRCVKWVYFTSLSNSPTLMPLRYATFVHKLKRQERFILRVGSRVLLSYRAARPQKGMFQYLTRLWNHFGNYLCRITALSLITLPNSHHGQIDISPMVNIVPAILNRLEELLEDRRPRLIVVMFISLWNVSYVFCCQVQVHRDNYFLL